MNIKIVVLGDIGHSPRMTNHAISLAKKGHTVDIVGYGESDPVEALKATPNIYYHYLSPCPHIGFKLLNYVWKTIWTSVNLLFLLFITRKSDMILVQNPPAIPTLYISWLYCKLIRSKLVIDWHNYAFTIMALSVGKRSFLVKITRLVEGFIGRRADHNFCVSKAMKEDLLENWQINAEVLYDCPSDSFCPITKEEKHNFFLELCKTDGLDLFRSMNESDTVFTELSENGEIHLRENRPAFLVSSTSWTEDEDFSILLNALQEYENHWKGGNLKKLPKLIVGITGKGPLKEHYCKDIESRRWEHIEVITPWLKTEDYPRFIASADIGVCLHTSSSGLDLPMKVVDLFGACVPVFAYNFKALNELVVDGKNGYVFTDEKQLSKVLQDWFEKFPNNEYMNKTVEDFKKELSTYRIFNWDKSWNQVASPVF